MSYVAITHGQIEIRTTKPYTRIPHSTVIVVTDEAPRVRQDNGKRCMKGYVEFYLADSDGSGTNQVRRYGNPLYARITPERLPYYTEIGGWRPIAGLGGQERAG